MSLAEIFRAVKTPKSTTLNIVRTLVRRRILELDPESTKYKPGHLLLALAGHAVRTIDLASQALPVLQQVAEATRETALLGVVEQDELVYVEAVNSVEPIRYVARIGTRRPLHGNSGGKLALAWLGEPAWEAYIERTGLPGYTETTVTDPEEFRAQLKRFRRLGYGISYGETMPDVLGLAAPVLQGERGKLLAVLILAAPMFRGRRNMKSNLKALRQGAAALSRLLA
jgi:DNA-binding IclR family transcriptional regulator